MFYVSPRREFVPAIALLCLFSFLRVAEARQCTVADYQAQNACLASWWYCNTAMMMLNGCSACDMDCTNVDMTPATVSDQILVPAGNATIATAQQIPAAIGNMFVQIGDNFYECVEIIAPGGSDGSAWSCVQTAVLVGGVAVSIAYPPVGIVIAAGVVIGTTVNCAVACGDGGDPALCQSACANAAGTGVVVLGTVAVSQTVSAAMPRPGTPVTELPAPVRPALPYDPWGPYPGATAILEGANGAPISIQGPNGVWYPPTAYPTTFPTAPTPMPTTLPALPAPLPTPTPVTGLPATIPPAALPAPLPTPTVPAVVTVPALPPPPLPAPTPIPTPPALPAPGSGMPECLDCAISTILGISPPADFGLSNYPTVSGQLAALAPILDSLGYILEISTQTELYTLTEAQAVVAANAAAGNASLVSIIDAEGNHVVPAIPGPDGTPRFPNGNPWTYYPNPDGFVVETIIYPTDPTIAP